jgi:HlyD family secretion protein
MIRTTTTIALSFTLCVALTGAACRKAEPVDRIRVSGYVEATEVQVSAEVGGRLIDLLVDEGDRVEAGVVVARLDTADIDLALQRARAEQQGADAQLRLLLAGARGEDIRQADAQRAASVADQAAAQRDLVSAERDLQRYDALIASHSGAEKPRDDAATRRDVAIQRVRASDERVRAATEALARLKAGARREELDVARARLAATQAQMATLEKSRTDATVVSPSGGVVTQKLVDRGELIGPRVPMLVIAGLDAVWANVYVDEPFVPRVTLGQPATIYTDAGGPGIAGKVTFISPKAEFTPRNVQTATERSKLVFRIKVTVDNQNGILKQGMPVEAEIGLQPRQ